MTGLRQDGEGVEVEIGGSDPRRLRAACLVGCDGGRSTVRGPAGIGFNGTGATLLGMICDAELSDPPGDFVLTRRSGPGDYSVIPLQPGWFRLMVNRHDRVLDRDVEPAFADFRASFRELAGTDHGMHSPRWVSHFGDAAFLADRYRSGRVLLAGDAAHIHYPAGGQGLNTGVQDAVNLGWKLAAVLRGEISEDLLDSYQSERRPVAARVLQNTRAQTALMRPGPHTGALREVLSGLFEVDEVRQRLGLMLFALDLRYDLGGSHPLTGRRVPDADLAGAGRVHELLRTGRPVLLSLNGTRIPPAAGNDRIDVVQVHSADRWRVPGLGAVPVPAAVFIRPDGHIAWATDEPGVAGLTEAITKWTGLEPVQLEPR